MDARIVGTFATLSTEAVLSDADVVVGDPSEWLVLQVPRDKRIYMHIKYQ